ncbi:OmpA family protein [Hydrogenophaga laconesensis]|uniref:Outer membrane protein OmpA-like peptidoglycan-associated protein n=1 Tax=Hydrogenophaga laconesensis TaxID=1805971 RepID=A0ABU1VH56_9BURK|nr:OmpA family protein [Hydrogenophaga laconesensis]MDR7096784.1 outer membrane protein OmpA-like peptidoglycan-associated protein [Hydrogenophaga laconesensis]
MTSKRFLPSLLALAALGGCAVTDPRATDRAPGAVPPFAESTRYTDEAQRADHRALQAVQDRLAALQKDGRVPQISYPWAKAQCWLDMARQNYHENDRGPVIGEAKAESLKLVEALEQGRTPEVSTPLIGGAVRLRDDLWARAERGRTGPGAACVAAQAACLEVQLVWMGHEYAEGGWRHANPYIGMAETMAARMEAEQAACATPAAAPVAAAPAPVVTERVLERLVLATDAVFQFDRSGLNDIGAAGRARLDVIADRARSLQGIERIVLVGHTDRLGDADYNQALSLRRATAVRDHLVSRGLDAALFTVEGKGSTEPVKTCSDGLARAALIQCLQDNRRVEVEIRGRLQAAAR